MSYKGIDSGRFVYLLGWSVDPSLIKAFIKERKRRLTLLGAKADNPPSDYRKLIKFVADLPEKAHGEIKDWFASHLVGISDEPIDQIVFRLLQAEYDMLELSDDERKIYSRTLFSLLLRDDTPQLVLKYLRCPLKSNGEKMLASPKMFGQQLEIDVQALVDVVIDNSEARLDKRNPISMLVAALLYAKDGNTTAAHEMLPVLKELLPQEADAIAQAILDISARIAAKQEVPHGVVIDEPLTQVSVSGIDPEAIDVVGSCTNILESGVRFIKVIGIRKEQDFVELSNAQTIELFPETGDVIWFQGAGHQLGPKLNELGIWRLQKKDFGEAKKVKFHVESFVGPVYDIVTVPYAADESDKIRYWLKKSYVVQPAVKPIFQLQDGLLVKPVNETTDFERLDYERPFDAWETLNAVRWQGRFLVLGKLPTPEREWECPPIASAIKKILRNHIEQESFPELSKRHIQQLCLSAEEEADTKSVSTRIERVHKELDRLADHREVTREIVSELLNVPSVRKEIEDAKEQIVSEFIKSKEDISGELEKLRRQKDSVVKEISQKKEDLKLQSAEVTKSVRKAFETAKAAGVDSLGQIALFQGVLGQNETIATSSSPGINVSPYTTRMLVAEIAGEKGKLSDKFIALGFSKSVARRLELAIEIGARVGFIISFRGSFASLIVREVSVAISRRTVLSIDIPVGLVDAVELDNVLRKDNGVDVVLLRNANNSAMDAYALSLQDIAARRISLGCSDSGPSILVSLSNGISALPLSTSLIETSFLFDLDNIEPENLVDDAEDYIEDIRNRLASSKRGGSTWLIGLSRLLDEISRIDSIDRPGVLGLIKQGVVEPFLDSLQRVTSNRG